MAIFRALCLAGAATLVASAAAHAADLLPPPPPVEAPFYQPVAPVIGGGWYLRGDVGAGTLGLRDTSSSFNPDYSYGTANGAPPGFQSQDVSLSEQALVDVGVGYQFNSFFRADVTGEYRFDSKYRALETYCFSQACDSGSGADYYRGNISNGVVLVNGYVDLGTWYGVTPYIGAGVGAAFNRFSTVVDENLNYYGTGAGQSASNTHTSLAYAAMAGFSFDLTRNLKIDVGYRYLDLGRAMTGAINCYGGTAVCGDNSREVQSAHLYSNDIRVGLRYAFADVIPYAPPPLIRKY